MLTFTANNEHDTDRLGAALAEVLPPGTVVALIGTLGAGKTRLVQAVAAALGVPPGSVTSPTFVLVNEYTGGRLPIYHFDTYRLKDDDEFLDSARTNTSTPTASRSSNGPTASRTAARRPPRNLDRSYRRNSPANHDRRHVAANRTNLSTRVAALAAYC